MKKTLLLTLTFLTLIPTFAAAQDEMPVSIPDPAQDSNTFNSHDVPVQTTPTTGYAAPATNPVKVNRVKSENASRSIAAPTVLPGDGNPYSAPSQIIDENTLTNFNHFYEITSRVDAYDNLDFRPVAPPNAPFIDLYDSDDRAIFATTRIAAGLIYSPIPEIETALSISHTGMWGNDNIGSTNAFGGFLFVDRLFVKWNIFQSQSFSVSTTFGRQHFDIGNFDDPTDALMATPRDYIFDDVIDGITLDVDFGVGGRLRILPIDMFALGARPSDIYAAAPYGPHKETLNSMHFNGDTFTLRTGGLYENTTLLDGLGMRGYFFYANIGAPGTGSDRAFNGATGNVTDKDYNWLGGIRLDYLLNLDSFALGIEAEYARSGGIDRKPVQAGYYDVNTDGNAFGASLIPAFRFGTNQISIPIQFFMADGSQHTSKEGLPFSHGFTSFKGRTVGGFLLSDGLGWRPSAHISSSGVSHQAHNKSRKAGSMVIAAGVNSAFADHLVDLSLDYYFLKDTGQTSFDMNNINTAANSPAFGFTRADIEAQQRLGKVLASEIDFTIAYNPFNRRLQESAVPLTLSLYSTTGVLIAGDFYKQTIDRQAGNFIGNPQPAIGWGTTFGLTLSL